MIRSVGRGDGFHGRKTAIGERFNAFAMTAAHRTRPIGSHVIVTNLANGRSHYDRVPSRRTGKIIDLSYGASLVIGLGGTARVCSNLWPRCEFIKTSNFNRTVDQRRRDGWSRRNCDTGIHQEAGGRGQPPRSTEHVALKATFRWPTEPGSRQRPQRAALSGRDAP